MWKSDLVIGHFGNMNNNLIEFGINYAAIITINWNYDDSLTVVTAGNLVL